MMKFEYYEDFEDFRAQGFLVYLGIMDDSLITTRDYQPGMRWNSNHRALEIHNNDNFDIKIFGIWKD